MVEVVISKKLGMKVLTICAFICSTYFWTAGWGFTVATEAGPPTVVDGS